MAFTKESHKQVFEVADKVHQSSQQLQVAAVGLDETQSAFTSQNQPQVVAFTRGQRPNRGGSQSGGGNQSSNQSSSNRGNRGGGRGKRRGRGGASGASQSSRGPRHSSNPPEACCDRHYRHGADSWYCMAPLTCPWVNKCTARP